VQQISISTSAITCRGRGTKEGSGALVGGGLRCRDNSGRGHIRPHRCGHRKSWEPGVVVFRLGRRDRGLQRPQLRQAVLHLPLQRGRVCLCGERLPVQVLGLRRWLAGTDIQHNIGGNRGPGLRRLSVLDIRHTRCGRGKRSHRGPGHRQLCRHKGVPDPERHHDDRRDDRHPHRHIPRRRLPGNGGLHSVPLRTGRSGGRCRDHILRLHRVRGPCQDRG